MKRFAPTLLIIGLLFSTLAIAQTKQTREVSAFTGIEISGAFKVYLRMGDKSGITVVADEDVIDRVKTTVNNDILEVEVENEWWDWVKDNDEIELYVTFKTLKSMELSGATNVVSKNSLRGTAIDIEASGACKLDLDFACTNLELDFSGATKATLGGSCTTLNIEASGASAIYAANLQTETLKMDISGATKAEVWATKTLNVEASGASKVLYKGDPELYKDVSGASSISKL